MLPRPARETSPLLAARLLQPHPPGHATHWLNWRRRHQARSRWYHQRAQLARDGGITLVSWQLPAAVVSGPSRGGCEQAEGAGPVDGLVAAVGAELVVKVAHVRPDGGRRQVQLAGDLRHGQVGGQVAQDAGLGPTERFAQAAWLAARPGAPAPPRRAHPRP